MSAHPTPEIDAAALATWLAARLPGAGLPGLSRIGGGQSNPTWFVDWGGARLVLRKKPEGPILPGAHAVEREFRVLSALWNTNVPVPRALWLEEDATILGTPFYVMERLEGRVFADTTLPGVTPDDRQAMYRDMARVLARLHAVRPADVGLSDFGKPGNYFARQIARWTRQYVESTGPRIAALDHLVDWLPANMPEDDGAVSIAHGDFRVGNLMWHMTEPRVIGVWIGNCPHLATPWPIWGSAPSLGTRAPMNMQGFWAAIGKRQVSPAAMISWRNTLPMPHPPGRFCPFTSPLRCFALP